MLFFVIYLTQPYKLSLNLSIKTCLLDFNNKSHNYFDDTINVQITIIETFPNCGSVSNCLDLFVITLIYLRKIYYFYILLFEVKEKMCVYY